MSAQQIVAANVAARGYRDGWTTEQFVARQLAKLTEELGEAAYPVWLSAPGYTTCLDWMASLSEAAHDARADFDNRQVWDKIIIDDLDVVRSELADMLVVLLTAAEALDFDVLQAAIDKSAADVARGVRNGV